MIFSIPLQFFYFVIISIIGVLPTSAILPSLINTSITWGFGLLYTFNFAVNIPFVMILVGLAIAFEAGVQLFKFVLLIIGIIRGR